MSAVCALARASKRGQRGCDAVVALAQVQQHAAASHIVCLSDACSGEPGSCQPWRQLQRCWHCCSVNPMLMLLVQDLRKNSPIVFTHSPPHTLTTRFCFASSRPQIPLQDMLQYKYQILVDGYSAAWDSSLWKLGSNSTVFYVHPQQHHDGRPHQVSGRSRRASVQQACR